MNRINFIFVATSVVLAMAFIASCSGDGEESYNYCITENNTCLVGPFTADTCKEQLSNSCPFGDSSSNSVFVSSSSIVSSSSNILSSSSSNENKSHSELCASGPSKDCLIGKWALDSDFMSACGEPGSLEFQANGDFYFEGTIGGIMQDDYYGRWTLEGSALTATNFEYTTPLTTGIVTISNGGTKMVVTSTGSVSTFVQCPQQKTYNFTWKN